MKELIITHSLSGYRLKEPVIIQVKENESSLETELRKYIIESFLANQNKLINFTLRNSSTMELVKYYYLYGTRSHETCASHISWINQYCQYLRKTPDELIAECLNEDGSPKPLSILKAKRGIGDFIAFLGAKGAAPSSIRHRCTVIGSFYRINNVDVKAPFKVHLYPTYEYRAPTYEEIQKILAISNVRNKFIIAALASSGLRTGTLAKLKYKDVKHDLENNIIPVHIHIAAEITKGKYRDYDTFLCQEAVAYLRAYLDSRRKGVGLFIPEIITDESILIRNRNRKISPYNNVTLGNLIRETFRKANLIGGNSRGHSYALRAHSFRKFFRTELASAGVDLDCVAYMMGHRGHRYSDVGSKGIEYMRQVYMSANLTLEPKTRENKIHSLIIIIRQWGLDPQDILKPEFSHKILDLEP